MTALLGRGLTPGKLRGLQRIANPNGTLTMLALDQNSSMISMAKDALRARGEERDPTYAEIVEAKLDLMRGMGEAASGVLIDAYYGAWAAVASGAMPPNRGMLVRVEKSGSPKNAAGASLAELEPGWSVAKIKRMGADAVKLLAPYEPTECDSAERQLHFIQSIYRACQEEDILFLLEPLTFPYNGEKKNSASYLDRKAASVIETARQLSSWCDIYKTEFPGTLDRESEGELRDNVLALSECCERPWVLLSAGVDYPQYLRQVGMAVEAGASGVLGGRAFWKEYFQQADTAARTRFAATTARARVAEVDALVRDRARPWWDRYGLSTEDLAAMRPAEGWHFRYGGTPAREGSGASAHVVRPGEVY